MDAYDCEKIDKEMSRRFAAVYDDPKRHKFYSVFEADENEDTRGPRGGKIRGKKRICAYCGGKAKSHAQTTEPI